MQIQYLTGDATAPIGKGEKIIVHVCNNIGEWCRGFVLAISKRWPKPEQRYRAWHRGETDQPFALGEVQFVQVTNDIHVANIIAQRDVRPQNCIPPIRYEALRDGVRRVAAEARRLNASVHMPRIGCGLAGGNWNQVGPIIQTELADHQIPVFVYDFPSTG
ncbi:MAG TPA: Appr-1-p processing protein [Verrucomicrobiae bacterium]